LLAVNVKLSPEQLNALDSLTQPVGDHHTAAQMRLFDRENSLSTQAGR